MLTVDGFALTALEVKPNMGPDNVDTSSLQDLLSGLIQLSFGFLGKHRPLEAGFAFGAHGRNLQGKAPHDVICLGGTGMCG